MRHLSRLPIRPPGFLPLFGMLTLLPGMYHLLHGGLDPDMFWHLRVAEQLLQDGIGPLVDSFSFSSITTPWTPYSWLAELFMREVWDWGGYRATLLTEIVLLVVILGFVMAAALQAPRISWLGALAATAIVLQPLLHWLHFRPVTFGILVLSVILWLWVRDIRLGEHSRGVWFIPVLTALGINLHPFAALAAIWMAIHYANSFFEVRDVDRHEQIRCRKRRFWLLLLTGAACCATPMLPGVIETIVLYKTQDPMVACRTCIAELTPLYEKGIFGIISIFIIIAIFSLIITQIGRLTFVEWMALVMVTALTIERGRYAPLMALTLLPTLSQAIQGVDDLRLFQPRLVRGLYGLFALLCAGLFWLFPSTGMSMQQWMERSSDRDGFPVAAADYVAKNVVPHHGRLINGFTWGGYIGWHLEGRFKVLMDGRTQVHPPEFWNLFLSGADQQVGKFLKSVKADAAILMLRDVDTERILKEQGWYVVYEDRKAKVLIPPCSIGKGDESTCAIDP